MVISKETKEISIENLYPVHSVLFILHLLRVDRYVFLYFITYIYSLCLTLIVHKGNNTITDIVRDNEVYIILVVRV